MWEPSRRAALSLLLAGPLGLALACAEGTGAEDAGFVCDPGEGRVCACEGGQASIAWCRHDGAEFLPCECEGGDEGFGDELGDGDGDPDPTTTGTTTGDGDGDPTGDGDGDATGDGDTDTGEEPQADEACYLGPAKDNAVCLPIAIPNPLPSDYDYPAPYQGSANYRAPLRYLDLDALDPAIKLAPNFALSELAQGWKGRYAVIQPHAVTRLQTLRDALGPLVVNSGYRSPGYNVGIGGASSSRHMFGDGFDLAPSNVSLATLEAACTQNAGFLVEYETHVHCDWRGTAVDVGFFGLPDFGADPLLDSPLDPSLESVAQTPALTATLTRDPDTGDWLAPASGFEEGVPMRRWTAFGADGRPLIEARGPAFRAPAGTAWVEVVVGARIYLRSP